MNARSDIDRAFIVHGYGAGPGSHWFPWLASLLADGGAATEIVPLPDASAPEARAWDAAVAEAVGRPDGRTALIGHSLGCIALLRHLARLEPGWSLRSLLLVAGFLDPLPNLPELDGFTARWSGRRALRDIASSTARRTVVRSDDDPVVEAAATDRLAAELGGRLVVVPGGGHFLDEGGMDRVPRPRRARLSVGDTGTGAASVGGVAAPRGVPVERRRARTGFRHRSDALLQRKIPCLRSISPVGRADNP